MPSIKHIIIVLGISILLGVLTGIHEADAAFTTYQVGQGGTGSTTLTGILKGNSTSAVQTAVPGTDYLTPTNFDTLLAATTSLPNIITLSGLSLPYSQLTGTPVIASSTLLTDANTFSGINLFTNSSSDFSGTWQTFSPSHFEPAFSTSTLTPSSPFTGSFVQIGSSGSLGCQTASGSQAGCLSSTDWATFNTKFATTSSDYWLAQQKGVAGGLATLDGGGKVPVSQLPNSIMEYQGTWNANTNTPTLADGAGSTGDVYRVTVAGTQNLGSGPITFGVGDYAIYNGSTWEKADTTDAVSTVNGFTGDVTLTTSDIAEGSNLYWTDTRFDNRLSATTSVKSITTLPSLSLPYGQLTGTPIIASSTLLGDNNTFSGTNTFSKAMNLPGSSIWNAFGEVGIGLTSPSALFDIASTTNDVPLFAVDGTYTDNQGLGSNALINFTPTVNLKVAASATIFKFLPALQPTADISTANIFNNNVTLKNSSNNFSTLNGIVVGPVLNNTYSGTVTNYRGMLINTPSVSGGQLTNYEGFLVNTQGVATNTAAVLIGDLTSSGNNVGIVTGQISIPTGQWDTYFNADYPAGFIATTTSTTGSKAVFKSLRTAITSGSLIGGIDFWSDDTSLTAPGTRVASIQAVANITHTASALGTDLTFNSTNGTTYAELMRLTGAGNLGIGTTSPNSLLSVRGGSTSSAVNNGVVQIGVSPGSSSGGLELGVYAGGGSLGNVGMIQGFNFGTGAASALAINPFGGNTILNPSSGNVGIGTSTPQALLSVGDNAEGVFGNVVTLGVSERSTDAVGISLRSALNNPTMQLCGGSGPKCNYFAVSTTTGSLLFGGTGSITTSDSAAFVALTSTGNLGIGTTSPSRTLDVEGNTSVFSIYSSGTASTSSSIAPVFYSPKNAVSLFLASGNPSATENTSAYGVNESSGDLRFNGLGVGWGDLGYYPNGGGNGNFGNFRLSLTGSAIDTTPDAKLGVGDLYVSGNVGIGTTTPAALLHLQSTAPAIMLSESDGTQAFNSTYLVQSDDSLTLQTRSAGNAFISNDYVIRKNASGALTQSWRIGNAEKMRIDSTGNVGIGTTTPGSLLSLNNIANFTAATSTFYSTGGINLAAGCFAVNGTCISGGAGSSASSTLLLDNNTFSGNNTFSSDLKLSNNLVLNNSKSIFFNGAGDTNWTLGMDSSSRYHLYFSGAPGNRYFTVTDHDTGFSSFMTDPYNNGGTFIGSTTICCRLSLRYASSTAITNTGSLFLTGVTNAVLGTDSNGLVAATTSIGTNLLTGVLSLANGGTGTSTAGIINGVEYYNGGTFTNSSNFVFTGTNVGIATTTPWSLFSLGPGAITITEASTTYASTVNISFQNTQTAKIVLTGNININLADGKVPGESRKIILCQDGTGSHTVTWAASSTLLWPGHTIPTMTATAKECDLYTFVTTGATGTVDVFGGYNAGY